MLELQVPLLAAKALLLLLLFAFIYVVVRRGIGDLRDVPDEDEVFSAGNGHRAYARRNNAAGKPAAMGNGSGRLPEGSELVVEDSDVLAPGTQFTLSGEETSLGRSSGSDIVLTSDDYASGRHARLTRHGGLLYVEDLGSTNGTFVNGNKAVGATPLRDGDAVKLGSTTFRFLE